MPKVNKPVAPWDSACDLGKNQPHTNKKLAHVDIFAIQIISIMGPNTYKTFPYYLHGV